VTGVRPWDAVAGLGTEVSTQRLDVYANEICRWNRAVRLVGPKDLDGGRNQIVDALLPFLLFPPNFPLLDIGSGAGLPGIALAVAFPGAAVVCVEPKSKKVSFLRQAVRVLALENIRIVPSSIEEAERRNLDLLRSFATATARAFGPVLSILASAKPFLAPGGRVYLPRGCSEEAPRAPGWRLVVDTEYQPPPGLGARRLLTYEVAAVSRD
jgi:16S rRNA (guanine527-N7)-methyltransferase